VSYIDSIGPGESIAATNRVYCNIFLMTG
jgi:hypothetical protein